MAINKTAKEWIIQGNFLPQCVLCIFIKLKALRETYHFHDQTLLDLSQLFFSLYAQRKYLKDKTF